MSYLTDEYLDKVVDIPVNLPVTNLKSNDWLVLTTIAVAAGQTLDFNFLQLTLVSSSASLDGCNSVEGELINPSYERVFVGIYENYVSTNSPYGLSIIGTDADLIQTSEFTTVQRDVTVAKLTLSPTEPTTYSFVIANNLTNSDLRVSVNGMARLTI